MIQFLINCLATSALNLLAGIAVSLVYLPTGCFPIHLGFVALAGAYTAWRAQPQLGLPLALAASALAAAATGLVSELAVLGPIRRRSIQPGMSLIASLAIFTIGIHTISMLAGDDVKSFTAQTRLPFSIGSANYLTLPQFATTLSSSLLFIALIFALRYTASGRKLLAVSYQPQLARIYGLRPERIRAAAVMIGSAISGLTAAFISWDTGLEPGLGFSLVVAGAVTMIVSGIGEPHWLLGGAILLGFLNNIAAVLLGAKWIQAVSLAIMILFLLLRPLGMSGRRLRKIAV